MKWALKTIPGTELLIPSHDNGATVHIQAQKKLNWDAAFAAIPEVRLLKTGDVVFDVGAWIGDTTAEFLLHGCIVHAFEPRPDLFVCLSHNCPKALCYNLALGNRETHGTVGPLGGNSGAYSLTAGDKFTIAIDDLPIQRLDFLKIDAEGYEGRVIAGAMETLKKFRPVLHLELNPHALAKFGDSPEGLIGTLKHIGYTVWRETYQCDGPTGPHWDCIVKNSL